MQLIIAMTVPEQKYVFHRLRLDSIQKSITRIYIFDILWTVHRDIFL